MTKSTESQNNFKVGNKVQEQFFQNPILTIEHVTGSLIMFEGEKHYMHESHYKLVPVYPNPPHVHVDMICHVAKGGVVINKSTKFEIHHVKHSKWNTIDKFEIMQPKTKKDIRIEELLNCIKLNEEDINTCKREINILKDSM